jgi:hypothetical protein
LGSRRSAAGIPGERSDSVSKENWQKPLLFSAKDELERQWFIVVGSGTSPFDPNKKMWRWMYGETNDLNQTSDAYMDDAYAEQVVHDVRDDR